MRLSVGLVGNDDWMEIKKEGKGVVFYLDVYILLE